MRRGENVRAESGSGPLNGARPNLRLAHRRKGL